MHRKYVTFAALAALLLSFTGCIEPVYFQQTETPPNLEGFLGFRWDTPMSILDDHILQAFDVIPDSRYNDYYSLAYRNYYFMDRKTSLCKFIFDDYGMTQINLFFRPDPENVFPELDYILGKLTEVYGSPVKMTKPATDLDYVGYIEGYYWFYGRLTVSLMPGDFIIIRAFAYPRRPPDEPPPPPHHRMYETGNAPPVKDVMVRQGN